MENLLFSVNTVAPVFIIIFIGIYLKRKKIIDEKFTSTSSNVVFKVALPTLIFKNIASTDFQSVFNFGMIAYSIAATILLYIIVWGICNLTIKNTQSRGAFVHGIYRGNYGIIGLQLVANLFGDSGLAKAAVLLSFAMPLYNILAVIVLTVTSPDSQSKNYRSIFINILKNPLIIAATFALPFSYFRIPLPELITKTIGYLSDVTMPLALLGLGGFFDFSKAIKNFSLSLAATTVKIVISPLVFTFIAICLGYRGENLAVIYVLFAAPTAVSSFIMAKAMDSNAELTANIILMTTFGSIFTIFGGIFILKSFALI